MPKQYKLSRRKSNREALVNNLVSSLILNGSIITTETRAKATKPVAENILSKAKNMTLSNQRLIRSSLNTKAADYLIKILATELADTSSGLVKIVKVVARKGDAADQACLLINKKKAKAEESKPTKTKTKKNG